MLIKKTFTRKCDPCLYTKKEDDKWTCILTYNGKLVLYKAQKYKAQWINRLPEQAWNHHVLSNNMDGKDWRGKLCSQWKKEDCGSPKTSESSKMDHNVAKWLVKNTNSLQVWGSEFLPAGTLNCEGRWMQTGLVVTDCKSASSTYRRNNQLDQPETDNSYTFFCRNRAWISLSKHVKY